MYPAHWFEWTFQLVMSNGLTDRGEEEPEGKVAFSGNSAPLQRMQEASQSLSLFPKLKVSLVPGTLLYDQENVNAQSRAKQTIVFWR